MFHKDKSDLDGFKLVWTREKENENKVTLEQVLFWDPRAPHRKNIFKGRKATLYMG